MDLVLDWWGSSTAHFADVGSGSGCLGLALLNKLPEGSSCTAIDISEEAVALSKRNAEKLGLSSVYDASRRSASELAGAFDFIVSNPPYIPSRDLQGLDAEVVDFEDPRALDGGADGLDVARELLDRAPLVFQKRDQLNHFLFRNERSVNSLKHGGSRWEKEHIAHSQQVFRPFLVEDGAGIRRRRNLEGNPRGEVGFDDAGQDIHTGPLGCDNQVHPDGTVVGAGFDFGSYVFADLEEQFHLIRDVVEIKPHDVSIAFACSQPKTRAAERFEELLATSLGLD